MTSELCRYLREFTIAKRVKRDSTDVSVADARMHRERITGRCEEWMLKQHSRHAKSLGKRNDENRMDTEAALEL